MNGFLKLRILWMTPVMPNAKLCKITYSIGQSRRKCQSREAMLPPCAAAVEGPVLEVQHCILLLRGVRLSQVYLQFRP